MASAEGASENFRVFGRTAAYDIIFFKFQGGGDGATAPPPAGAHAQLSIKYSFNTPTFC